MALPPYAITSDTELKDAVRDMTSYDDTGDELPESQLDGLVNKAKRDMHVKTGEDGWYNDLGYGNALTAHLAIVSKAAVENINISSYSIGDESMSLMNADPEDSQQIQQWAADVKSGLDNSDLNLSDGSQLKLSNTASYIG